MRTKWTFHIFLVLFLLSAFGCQSAEITCRPSSSVGGPPGESGRITIEWDSVTEKTLAGYKIYYGLSSRKYIACVDIGNPGEYSPGRIKYALTGLTKGKEYHIAVIAYSNSGKGSDFSSEVRGVAK